MPDNGMYDCLVEEVVRTKDARIEKLENEVAELRAMVNLVLQKTASQ